MTSRKQLVTTFLLIAAFVALAGTLVQAVFYAPEEEVEYVRVTPTPEELAQPEYVPPSEIPVSKRPETIKIPSLGIDADVQHTGVKTDGSMANPSNFTDVGWYKHGMIPGFVGSAVMAGHVDNGLKLDGVFKHLEDIQVGEEVIVVAADGTESRFRVTGKELFDYNATPPKDIFLKADGAYLNLITCTGSWIAEKKTYGKRLVVYTKLVE